MASKNRIKNVYRMKNKSDKVSVFTDCMNSTEFLCCSFFPAIVFIPEKPITLFNKSQFCAFEMENNEIKLLI